MNLDFHTHGKLAKYLPFSEEYTDWLLKEAKNSGLDAICLTEHYNTQEFDRLYRYISKRGVLQKDTYIIDGLKIFPGMETDIQEGGHVLSIGPMEAILELNHRLEFYKAKGKAMEASKLMELFSEYPVLVGAAHPFRDEGHIPELPANILNHFDFIDMNGKDIALDRDRTLKLTKAFGIMINRPVVAGSDTHQSVQYGSIKTCFEKDFSSFKELKMEMDAGRYTISIHPEAELKVKTAALLKRSLKEIHALGGDYVSVLLRQNGESPAVLKAKGRVD